MPSVLRETPDGTLVLGYAYMCPRTISGKWKCGSTPLDELPGTVIAWGSEAERIFKERREKL